MGYDLPPDLMDDIVREIIKLQELPDFGIIPTYNEYLEFLYRVLLNENPLDRHKTAADIRTKLRRKKITLGNQPATPLGWEYELFNTISKDSKTPYDDFLDLLNTAIDDRAKTPMVRYTVVYPLNFKVEESIKSKVNENNSGEISGRPFEIIPYSKFAATLTGNQTSLKADESAPLQKKFNEQYSFCIIKNVCGRDDEFVLDYCNSKLISILGVFALAFGGRVTFGSEPEPVRKITATDALIFKNGSFMTQVTFADRPSSFEKVDHSEVEAFTYFLDLFNQIKAVNIIDRLSDALASFFQAAIEDDMASAYLKYWVCIENCRLGATHEQMIKRLSRLPFWRRPYWSYQILLMREIRNGYVHQLETQISQFDRNLANFIVGNFIRYLLRIGCKFADQKELDLFLELVSTDDPDFLVRTKEMTELASKEIEDYKASTLKS